MEAKLIIFKADGQRKDFPLVNPVSAIGRGENCELRVPLLSVSRKHCELSITKDGLLIKDIASSNGTYVNNKRINEQLLKPGDRIVVGPIVFTVQIDGQPQEIKPVKATASKLPAEEIVDLEADVVEMSAASIGEMAEEPEKEVDVISALEAMAAESTDQKKKK